MKSCFFTGHLEALIEVLPALCAAVELGVTEFVINRYGSKGV